MVLTGTEWMKRWEVGIHDLAGLEPPADAVDVDADEAAADVGDVRSLDAVFQHAEDAEEAGETPHAKGHVHQLLVARHAHVEVKEVVPCAGEDEDGQHDVGDQEELKGAPTA